METEHAELKRLQSGLDDPKRRLAERPNASELARYAQLIDQSNRRLGEYNARVEEFNRTGAARRREIEASQKGLSRSWRQYQRWHNKGGPLKLSTRINRLLARWLVRKRRDNAAAAPLEGPLASLRQLRSRMAQQTIQSECSSSTGLLIVSGPLENLFQEAEECWFLVDNACASSVFTPEIITAMGFEPQVRAGVHLQMADGSRVKVPQCAAPGVVVQGCRASFVKGVIMRETKPGLDGTLGMSFLSRFDFSIQKASPQRLVLNTLRSSRSGASFDVFICFASEDSAHARVVYNELAQRGCRVFFSEVSVPATGNADFQRAIDQAIESARHLVLICSSVNHVLKPWVEAEWRLFEGLRRSGQKHGNIVPVLFGGLTQGKLPGALSVFSSVSAKGLAEEWVSALLSYLR